MDCRQRAYGERSWPCYSGLWWLRLIVPVLLLVTAVTSRADGASAITTLDPDIAPDELELLVKPLEAEELVIEAEAWLVLLKAKTLEVSQAEIAVKQKNRTIDKAEQLMHDILHENPWHENPWVLDEPTVVIAVQELAEYSVNFVCRPWTETPNYWQVYWDITRSIKERFEQAGLETPYPHHNLHQRRDLGA